MAIVQMTSETAETYLYNIEANMGSTYWDRRIISEADARLYYDALLVVTGNGWGNGYLDGVAGDVCNIINP